MGHKKLKFTIGELHQLVWTESISQLSKRLDFNETVLRKKCKELGIPTPTSAYWSGLRFGKSVKITALPKSINPKLIIALEHKTRKRYLHKETVKAGSTDSPDKKKVNIHSLR